MIVHPDIAALRGNTPSQRRAGAKRAQASAACLQAAREQWLASAQVQQISDDLARYGAGGQLAQCQALGQMMRNASASRTFVDGVTARILPALRKVPLGEAPFRFRASHGLSSLRLIEQGRAQLSLAAYEPLDSVKEAQSAVFSDGETTEIVISGAANGLFHRRMGEGACHSHTLQLQKGTIISCKARVESRQIVRVERALVVLNLTREAMRPAPTIEVALPNGQALRSASGDKSASQALMALSVLGALGAGAALDTMIKTAMNPCEDADVRWEAVRQSLGLDAARGLELLGRLRAADRDPLSAPARALHAQLATKQPSREDMVKEPA